LKYWRGYLVAAIFAACTWGLAEFAQSHWVLVDMVYPYVTRLIQTFLTDWSASVDFCLWQLMLLVAGAALLASIVMMFIWKWNPIQWFGWVIAAVSIVIFCNTVIVGLNDYSGALAQDVQLEVSDYTLSELEEAGAFYQERANILAQEVSRDAAGQLQYPPLQELALQAAEGFEIQTYQRFHSIFAGSTVPVKELGWSDLFASRGITGITVGITGEAAVNPQTPAVAMPFVICREMAKRMCITNDQDAAFAAFMACDTNSAPEFRYAAYFMAYRYCVEALRSMDTSAAQASAAALTKNESDLLKKDKEAYDSSFAAEVSDNFPAPQESAVEDAPQRSSVADLLVSWHIQEYVLPSMMEEEILFDPLDESQVDLSGLPHTGTEATEETIGDANDE